ncbi:hypothetical protein CC86DRAFT_369101 [Ophiobolus disseminans]|uniref:Uncharacterized protein n=1 Tax=Ophiobolus disseminans TaxID=1469910 RepID=A0A6A7A5L6_9PLEO|nr:hypothetical protein CC86DRAFT_369101 [Ophiobolus disseminans]
MAAEIVTPPKSAHRPGRKVTSGTHDLNLVFSQARVFQDLLHFKHDPDDLDPAVVIVQEYARAIRLLYIEMRWSKLGLSDWHSEMHILLHARASVLMDLDIWDPLDDFFDTYIFEMEAQPLPRTSARARKIIKRGLLRQLHEIAIRELENCHKDLCDLLGDRVSNWRLLDSKLLAFKKKVWTDCEERGRLSLTTASEATEVKENYAFVTAGKTEGGICYVQP